RTRADYWEPFRSAEWRFAFTRKRPTSCSRAPDFRSMVAFTRPLSLGRLPRRWLDALGPAHREWRFYSREHRAGPDSRRPAARAPGLDRHSSALRAGRLRRVHVAHRWGARAILHHLCRPVRRGADHNYRGTRERSRYGRTAKGVHRRAWLAMRLLYARHADHRARHRLASSRRRRAPHSPRTQRQSLP